MSTGEPRETEKDFWLASIQAVGLSKEQEADLRIIYDQYMYQAQSMKSKLRSVDNE